MPAANVPTVPISGYNLPTACTYGTSQVSHFVITCFLITCSYWKVNAYGIYIRVVEVSEIERVSAANE